MTSVEGTQNVKKKHTNLNIPKLGPCVRNFAENHISKMDIEVYPQKYFQAWVRSEGIQELHEGGKLGLVLK